MLPTLALTSGLGQLRLLLGEAMKRTQTPDEFRAVNRHNRSGREGSLDRFDRRSIVRVGVGWNKDDLVRYVKIGVTRREDQIFALHLASRRQLYNLEPFAPDAHLGEPRKVFL
jgi:hypothetical protein